MLQKQHIKILLIAALAVVSSGGWLMHFRTHPVTWAKANFIPFVAGIISVLLVTVLFSFKKTIPYAYVINGMIVMIGTIVMGHMALAYLPKDLNLATFFLDTTIPYILVLWTKFMIGKAIFDLDRMASIEMSHRGKFFRYPNMGFWWVHLAAMSIVYGLGNRLW